MHESGLSRTPKSACAARCAQLHIIDIFYDTRRPSQLTARKPFLCKMKAVGTEKHLSNG
jgi:hypothetical protein